MKTRTTIRAIALGSAAALTLASGPSRAADPIKIGVLLPLSGNFAENGQQTLTGIKMYLDEIGSKAGGRDLELVVEDTQGKPDVAVTKAHKEVERDEVQVLSGLVLSSEALAVNDYSRQAQVPLVMSGDAGVDEVTMPGPLANPYLVRTSQNGRTVAAAGADWAYKKGWHKVATVGSDYAGGVDTIFSFSQAFCKLGGKVIQSQWPPLNSADFGPYLTNLDRSADAIVVFEPGADGLRFGKQYSEFGLKGKMPVMDIYGTIVYEPNQAQLGDAVVGMYSSLFYTPMLKTPENERFVPEFKKRMNGSAPSNEGPNGYVGMHAIVDAITAVKGDLSDKTKFVAALKAVHFNSPKGPIKLDKYGMVIQTMYIREAQKVDGGIGNVPIASYPNVDQFWPFAEADFQSLKATLQGVEGPAHRLRQAAREEITLCRRLPERAAGGGASRGGNAMTRRNEAESGATLAPAGGKRPVRRRVLLTLAAAGAAALTFVAPALPAPDAEPIKIGILVPLSGNFAAPGQQTLAGLKIYFDEIGNAAGGHPLALIVEDTQGNPEVAVTKARKLVERDGAQVLTGIVSSGVALAVSDYAKTSKVPLVLSGDAAADELTMPGALANPYLVRVSENSRTPSAVAADFAYKTKGWRKVTIVSSDYVAGLDLAFAFAQMFCKLGGTVAQAQYPPLDTADYGPYLTNLDRATDAMVVFTPGAAGLKLGRQYAEFGLHGKLPALDMFGTLTYESYLPQLGDAVLGTYSALIYTPFLDTPVEQELRRRIQEADRQRGDQRRAERLGRRARHRRRHRSRPRRSFGQDEIHGRAEGGQVRHAQGRDLARQGRHGRAVDVYPRGPEGRRRVRQRADRHIPRHRPILALHRSGIPIVRAHLQRFEGQADRLRVAARQEIEPRRRSEPAP